MAQPFPRLATRFVLAAAAVALIGARPAGAASHAGAATDEEEDAPTQAPLTVGTMAIASDPNLAVEAMAVDVALDRVTYNYRLRNKGKTKLDLAASVALPDLEVNSETDNIYVLPSSTPENPVDLAVTSNGASVATVPQVQAVALGLDRLAELKADGLPLIPFGAATEKALAAAKPELVSKLTDLGLVTPRDPAQPDAPPLADWSLHVTHGWTQTLAPEAATNVAVSFRPIKATYRVEASTLAAFDALKDQVCLTPAMLTAARALAKGKNGAVDVDDITLANDGPARWLDNPPATVGVRKPQPNAVVAFCGMDPKSAGSGVVTGKMPGSDQAAGLRVLVFTTAPGN